MWTEFEPEKTLGAAVGVLIAEGIKAWHKRRNPPAEPPEPPPSGGEPTRSRAQAGAEGDRRPAERRGKGQAARSP